MGGIRFQDRLYTRNARLVVVIALLLGLAFAAVQIGLDYAVEVRTAVGQSAWDIDPDLAKEIAGGLLHHPSIIRVRIVTDFGRALVDEARPAPEDGLRWASHWLFGEARSRLETLRIGPADNRRIAGHLALDIDPHATTRAFLDRAAVVLGASLARNAVFALVLLALFRYTLSRPLDHLIGAVSAIDPNRPGAVELSLPKGHERGEVAYLVAATNRLLSVVATNMERRGGAEAARLAAERQLSAGVNSLSAAFLLFDGVGNLLLVNRQTEDVFPSLARSPRLGAGLPATLAALAASDDPGGDIGDR